MKRRDWGPAWDKVREEGCCRVCHRSSVPIDPAHIIPRSRGGTMDPLCICPLCRDHHTLFDQHELELLPFLTLAEQAYAVALVGIAEAYRRTTVSVAV